MNEYSFVKFRYESIKDYISVIIPVYKDCEGLQDTLNSIRNSDYPQNKYEIIVANDGADKEICELCERYSVLCINVYPKGGSYNARNNALSHARGEYIAFTDADVQVDNQWLFVIRQSLIQSDYAVGKTIINPAMINTLADDYEAATAFGINKRCLVGPTVNVAVKRKVFELTGAFDSRLQSGGDYEFGDRVLKQRQKLKRNYYHKMLVLHPPRGHKNMIKKYKRIMQGKYEVIKYHPKCSTFPRDMTFQYLIRNIFDFSNVTRIVDKMTHTQHARYLKLIYVWYMEAVKLGCDYYYKQRICVSSEKRDGGCR